MGCLCSSRQQKTIKMSFYNKNKLTIAGTVGVVVGGGGIAMLIAGIVQMAKGYCDGSNSKFCKRIMCWCFCHSALPAT